MKKLNFPNIIKLYEIISNDKSDKMYIGKSKIFKLIIIIMIIYIYSC